MKRNFVLYTQFYLLIRIRRAFNSCGRTLKSKNQASPHEITKDVNINKTSKTG